MSGQGGASTSGLAFSGWLSSRDVITLLVVQLVLGPDYLVYAAAAVSVCLTSVMLRPHIALFLQRRLI